MSECKHCKDNKIDLLYAYPAKKIYMYLEPLENRIEVRNDDGWGNITKYYIKGINHCPFCGRTFDRKEEGE